MSSRSEYHKQYRLKNKDKLNDYHKKYYHIKKNNDIDDNTNVEQNEKIEINTEPIKKYDFTEKRKLAFKKMIAARKKQLEELKEKQGINKMDGSDNSTYLTDYPLNKIIEIYNFKTNLKNNPKYKFKVNFILTVKELTDIDI